MIAFARIRPSTVISSVARRPLFPPQQCLSQQQQNQCFSGGKKKAPPRTNITLSSTNDRKTAEGDFFTLINQCRAKKLCSAQDAAKIAAYLGKCTSSANCPSLTPPEMVNIFSVIPCVRDRNALGTLLNALAKTLVNVDNVDTTVMGPGSRSSSSSSSSAVPRTMTMPLIASCLRDMHGIDTKQPGVAAILRGFSAYISHLSANNYNIPSAQSAPQQVSTVSEAAGTSTVLDMSASGGFPFRTISAMSSSDVSRLMGVFKSMNCSEPEVNLLLSTLPEHFRSVTSANPSAAFTGFELSFALHNLRGLSSEDPIVREVVSSLLPLISNCREVMTAVQLSHALTGLRGMSSDHEEVRSLLSVLCGALERSDDAFDVRQVCVSINGLSNMSPNCSEVNRLVTILGEKLRQCKSSNLCVRDIENAFYGLTKMTSSTHSVRNLISALTEKIIESPQSVQNNPKSISVVLWGMQSLSISAPEVANLFSLVTFQLKQCPPASFGENDLARSFPVFSGVTPTDLTTHRKELEDLLSALTNKLIEFTARQAKSGTLLNPLFLARVCARLPTLDGNTPAMQRLMRVITDALSGKSGQLQRPLSANELCIAASGLRCMSSINLSSASSSGGAGREAAARHEVTDDFFRMLNIAADALPASSSRVSLSYLREAQEGMRHLLSSHFLHDDSNLDGLFSASSSSSSSSSSSAVVALEGDGTSLGEGGAQQRTELSSQGSVDGADVFIQKMFTMYRMNLHHTDNDKGRGDKNYKQDRQQQGTASAPASLERSNSSSNSSACLISQRLGAVRSSLASIHQQQRMHGGNFNGIALTNDKNHASFVAAGGNYLDLTASELINTVQQRIIPAVTTNNTNTAVSSSVLHTAVQEGTAASAAMEVMSPVLTAKQFSELCGLFKYTNRFNYSISNGTASNTSFNSTAASSALQQSKSSTNFATELLPLLTTPLPLLSKDVVVGTATTTGARTVGGGKETVLNTVSSESLQSATISQLATCLSSLGAVSSTRSSSLAANLKASSVIIQQCSDRLNSIATDMKLTGKERRHKQQQQQQQQHGSLTLSVQQQQQQERVNAQKASSSSSSSAAAADTVHKGQKQQRHYQQQLLTVSTSNINDLLWGISRVASRPRKALSLEMLSSLSPLLPLLRPTPQEQQEQQLEQQKAFKKEKALPTTVSENPPSAVSSVRGVLFDQSAIINAFRCIKPFKADNVVVRRYLAAVLPIVERSERANPGLVSPAVVSRILRCVRISRPAAATAAASSSSSSNYYNWQPPVEVRRLHSFLASCVESHGTSAAAAAAAAAPTGVGTSNISNIIGSSPSSKSSWFDPSALSTAVGALKQSEMGSIPPETARLLTALAYKIAPSLNLEPSSKKKDNSDYRSYGADVDVDDGTLWDSQNLQRALQGLQEINGQHPAEALLIRAIAYQLRRKSTTSTTETATGSSSSREELSDDCICTALTALQSMKLPPAKKNKKQTADPPSAVGELLDAIACGVESQQRMPGSTSNGRGYSNNYSSASTSASSLFAAVDEGDEDSDFEYDDEDYDEEDEDGDEQDIDADSDANDEREEGDETSPQSINNSTSEHIPKHGKNRPSGKTKKNYYSLTTGTTGTAAPVITNPAQRLTMALFGLNNMRATPEVLRILPFITSRLNDDPSISLNAIEIANALYGLRNMNGVEPEVKALIKALTIKIENCTEELPPRYLSRALFGLQSMNAESRQTISEVTGDLLEALDRKLRFEGNVVSTSSAAAAAGNDSSTSPSTSPRGHAMTTAPFTAQEVSTALYGLKSMPAKDWQVRRVLNALTYKLQQCPEQFSGRSIAYSLYSLKDKDDESKAMQQLTSALADKINASTSTRMDTQEIGMALFGLKRLRGLPGSQQLQRAMGAKLNNCVGVFDASSCTFALRGMESCVGAGQAGDELFLLLADKISQNPPRLDKRSLQTAEISLSILEANANNHAAGGATMATTSTCGAVLQAVRYLRRDLHIDSQQEYSGPVSEDQRSKYHLLEDAPLTYKRITKN